MEENFLRYSIVFKWSFPSALKNSIILILIPLKAFALIELLVVVALLSILSAVGIVTYNGYVSGAKDRSAYSNFNQIVKAMNNELANCRINPSAKIFTSHSCDSNSEPEINNISNRDNITKRINQIKKESSDKVLIRLVNKHLSEINEKF